MNKILLIGEKYSSNLGDGVIFFTVKNILEQKCDCQVDDFDISGRDNYDDKVSLSSKFIYQIKDIFRKTHIYRYMSSKKRVTALKKRLKRMSNNKYNYIVIAGGQLFLNYFVDCLVEITKYAEENKIKIIYNSIGFGSLSQKNKKRIMKLLNNKCVKSVSIRDNFKFYEKNKGSINIYKALDPVFELSTIIKKKQSNKEFIGIGVMDPSVYEKNYDFDYYIFLYKSIIKVLKAKKIKYCFFTNGSKEDYNFALRIKAKMGCECELFNRPISYVDLINDLNKFTSIISFRLHSHIIMTSYNIRTMGFIWNEKIKDFSEIVGNQENFYEIDTDLKNNIEMYVNKFINSMNDKVEIKFICKSSEYLNKEIGL